MNYHLKAWEDMENDIYSYLTIKLPFEPETTKKEISTYLASMFAITWYDNYERAVNASKRATKWDVLDRYRELAKARNEGLKETQD